MTTPDYFVLLLYLVVLVAMTFKTFSPKWKNVFGSSKKAHWLLGGLSLFMMTLTVDVGQLYNGIIQDKGIWGLWLLWNAYVIIGVVPIVFAPLWARLDFITDNQFILFRFSGRSAQVLYRFRGIYVGGIIVAFLLSFQVLAFQRILTHFFEVTPTTGLWISGLLLILFAAKNSFSHKIKMDSLHAVIYFVAMLVAALVLINMQGGWSEVIETAQSSFPEKLKLVPDWEDTKFISEFLIYITILWWSASMFDGGGQEAQRFFNMKNGKAAIKAALVSLVFKQGAVILVAMTIIAGMSITGFDPQVNHTEGAFVSYFSSYMPDGVRGLCLLGFFVAFITTAESQLNWGSSFLVVDLYQNSVPNKSERHYAQVSFMTMIGLSAVALLIALYSGSIHQLVQFFFSISAGVAPVFILRWVWLRINAWSQLSAMIGSLLYSFLFNLIADHISFASDDRYAYRIVAVTVLTTITWLVVTFLTAPDDEGTLMSFRQKVPMNSFSLQRIFLALLVGVLYLGLQIAVLYLLFNSF